MSFLNYIQLAGGLIYLLAGGDLLVRGAVALARRVRVSPTLIAFTVVAIGTSIPELVVVLRAALTGHPGLALGNVVGSNIANVLLVGGVAAVVHPLTCGDARVRRDSVVMLGASALLIALCLGGELPPLAGVFLLCGLAIVWLVMGREAARAYRDAEFTAPVELVLGLPNTIRTILLFIVVGAVGLPLGAKLVVDAAVSIALQLGVRDTIVGLTILAVGTSLPELATTVVAAVQRRTEVAIGAIIGSNVFNILAIMGTAALVSPSAIAVPRSFLLLDLPVMMAAAIALSVFVLLGRAVGRTAGVVLVTAYVAYLVVLFLGPWSPFS